MEPGTLNHSTTPKRSACRYHGGKWKLADWVIRHFPPHRFYVEPFGGGASVLLKKTRAACELYNDLDGDVVNYFQVLRDPALAARLKDALELTPFARDEFHQAYCPYHGEDAVEKARRFFVRLAMGWGTKMQSSRRSFRGRRGLDESTPARDFINFPPHIKSFTQRLRGVVIENRPAREIFKIYDDRDVLFYCDPPYLKSTRSNNGSGTYKHEMTDADHEELAETLYKLKGMALISGYPSELYERLYTRRGWLRKQRVHRAEMAKQTMECLWLSPLTLEALSKKSLFSFMN